MPVEVKGLIELQKALREFSPDLDKQLSKDVRAILKPIVQTARSYATPTIPGLSNWTFGGKAKQISVHTSMFGVSASNFPKYNAAAVRAGIKYSIRKSRPNKKGWSAIYSIINTTAAGQIMETAGRKNFAGSSKSKSMNPYAGYHFNLALNTQSELAGKGTLRGRLMYRAWAEDQTKATNAVLRAIQISKINFAKTAGHSRWVDAQKSRAA
jgi:hypothetical protein